MGRHRRSSSSLSGPSRSSSSRGSNNSTSKKKRKSHGKSHHEHKDRKRSDSRDRGKKRRREQHRRRRSVSSSKSRSKSSSASSYHRSRERDRFGRNNSGKDNPNKHKPNKDHRSKAEPETKHLVSVPVKASQVFEPIGPLAQNKPTGGIGFAIPSTSEAAEGKKPAPATTAPVFEFDDNFRVVSESHEFRKTEASLNQNNAERDSVFSIPTPKNLQILEGAYRSDSQTERAESVAGANSIQHGEISRQKLPLIIPPRRFNTTASQQAAPSEDGQQSSQDIAEIAEGVSLKRPPAVFKEDEIQNSDEPEEDPEDDDEMAEMANVLGFSSFGTTKGKNHTKDAVEGVHKNKNQVQKFRQYMNRKGGCHLPLPSVKE